MENQLPLLLLNTSGWSGLEAAKLGVDILIPVSIFISGWFVNRQLKKLEHSQWTNQKLIEKRLELHDLIAPKLNDLLCFYTWIGDWKELSPPAIVVTKRKLDKLVHVNRYLLGEDFLQAYQHLMNTCFLPWMEEGTDARIRTEVARPNYGDRTRHGNYTWQEEWEALFCHPDQTSSLQAVEQAYYQLLSQFRDGLGIVK